MPYVDRQQGRAYDKEYATRRTPEQRKRRQVGDRARYRARARLEEMYSGDYYRLYFEEYAKAEKELGLTA